MHWEQSRVGKVSDSFDMLPPSDGSRSTSTTGWPELAMSNAERMPATPPPMTRAALVTGTSTGSSGLDRLTRSTAAVTVWQALAEA